MDSTRRHSVKWAFKCHGCNKVLKGRAWCRACEPDSRRANWHKKVGEMYAKDPRPLSIAVKMGVNAKDVIKFLKQQGIMPPERYKDFEGLMNNYGDETGETGQS